MQFESQSEPAQETQFFPQKPALLMLILVLLFIAAFLIRIHHIDEPPLDFNPVRQYRSAIIARGLYFETVESIPEWRKEVASINKQQQGVLEPPIMEYVAFFAYRVVGGEHLWIPRVLSSVFWLIGGVFLYFIARRIVSTDAALFSAAFYLFLPFGVSASRSFQPDPMMVMMFLFSIFTIVRYYDRPSMRRLAIAATISALAILIKPVCLFAILGAFVSLAICTQGLRRAVINRDFLIFVAVSLLPGAIYNMYGLFIAGSLEPIARYVFDPHLLLYRSFWAGLLDMISSVVGYAALVAALLGVLMFRQGLPRGLLIGLWVGYSIFGLVFTYYIHTHAYYHLQLIPIVALSLGTIFALLIGRLGQICKRWHWRVAIYGILLLALLIAVRHAPSRVIPPAFEDTVRIAQEIGESVGHSTKTILLTPAQGYELRYHGELAGGFWPITFVLYSQRLVGIPQLTVEERFNDLYLEYSPEYFIVTDFQELEEQADLKSFLTGKFPIAVQSDDYLIFDLRETLAPGN